jgi:hypothetical protein
MRRTLLVVAVTLVLAPATTAQAQTNVVGGASVILYGPDLHQLSDTQVVVGIRGAVAVDFHGSATAGCASMGLCDVSGSTTWDPGRSGLLDVIRYVQHGKRRIAAYLASGSITAAQTSRRTPDGRLFGCGDAKSGSTFADVTSPSLAAISLRLVDTAATDFVRTHCAGPLATDIVKLLPVRPLSRTVLDGKGGETIDLSTTRPFSAAGFAGTLRSSVVLTMGRTLPSETDLDKQTEKDLLKALPPERTYHELRVSYRIKRVTGKFSLGFKGTGDPDLCADFDSCGVTGATVVSPAATGGELRVSALAPARRPWADLRTPFGLARGGRFAGVRLAGSGRWSSSTGSMTATVAHDDGGATCIDSVPMRHGILDARVTAGRLAVGYYLGGTLGEPDQTRCPGPSLTDLPFLQAESQTTVPLSVLSRRTITLHLTGRSSPFSVPGYAGTTQQDLTVVLQRTRVQGRTLKARL